MESAFEGDLSRPESEEQGVFVVGLRVAIVDCVQEIKDMGSVLGVF